MVYCQIFFFYDLINVQACSKTSIFILQVRRDLLTCCCHVIQIEAAVRIGYTTSSCTSEACKWNSAFLKNVTAAPISDIRFYKDNHGSKSSKKHKNHKHTLRAGDSRLFKGVEQSLPTICFIVCVCAIP